MERQQVHLSILIVGAHPNVCHGLEALLKTSPFVGEVRVASYSNVQDILDGSEAPDVVLADVVAEDDDYASTVLVLRNLVPQSHFIVLSLARCFPFEEKGFRVLLKSTGTEDLMWILKKVVTEKMLT